MNFVKGINKLKPDFRIYEDPYIQSDKMNKSVQSLFIKESNFDGINERKSNVC